MSYESSFATPGWNDPPSNLPAPPKSGTTTSHIKCKHRHPLHPAIQQSAIGVESSSGNASQVVPLPDSNNLTNFFIPNTSPTQLMPPHRAIFDAFTVPGAQMPADNEPVNGMFMPTSIPPRQSFAKGITHHRHSSDSPSRTLPVGPPIEANPNALIYTPPNMIGENNRRPSTSPQTTVVSNPVKAAGDVSLSGAQLVQFLNKAAHRLPTGVTRDGILLRISEFHDLFNSGCLSEGCLKKLNFVVDALDRDLIDDALQFFEQLQMSFPIETKSGWAQGIRLLLNELRRPVRSGSAGPIKHF